MHGKTAVKSTVLETPRLQMRRMTQDDIPALLTVFADPEVMWHYPATFDGQPHALTLCPIAAH